MSVLRVKLLGNKKQMWIGLDSFHKYHSCDLASLLRERGHTQERAEELAKRGFAVESIVGSSIAVFLEGKKFDLKAYKAHKDIENDVPFEVFKYFYTRCDDLKSVISESTSSYFTTDIYEWARENNTTGTNHDKFIGRSRAAGRITPVGNDTWLLNKGM